MTSRQQKSIDRHIERTKRKGHKPGATVFRFSRRNKKASLECFQYIGKKLGYDPAWATFAYNRHLATLVL